VLVLLTESDLKRNTPLLKGLTVDYDTIMVNQVMFSFKRTNGYMRNNVTSETWSWKEKAFKSMLNHPEYDHSGDYYTWVVTATVNKASLLLACLIGFSTLSAVNGLIIRLALVCSNVIVFPLMWIVRVGTGQALTNAQLTQVYHQMGIVGAEAAHMDR